MKIYTKTGDKGQTSLVGGTRVSKTHMRIEAYGTVDELNAHLGMLADQNGAEVHLTTIKNIQTELFTIGSNLALEEPGKFDIPGLDPEQIGYLEKRIDKMEEGLPVMRNFVLPGGHPAVSSCHIARTVCRRAEREVIRMAQEIEVDETIIRFLNRLSDFLFILSRRISFDLGVEEHPWIPRKNP